jgi:hypothetical protein
VLSTILAFPGRLSKSYPSSTPRSLPEVTVPEDVSNRIRLLDERLARLRQERGRLLARASQADRRRDTRRKILIGAAMLAAVDHEGIPNLNSLTELLHWLEARLNRPYDRTAFGFDVRAAAK